jgi:hypothetical protein
MGKIWRPCCLEEPVGEVIGYFMGYDGVKKDPGEEEEVKY